MTVDIGAVVERGVERTIARNGLVFVGLFFVFGLALSFLGTQFGPEAAVPVETGVPDYGISDAVAVALWLAVLVVMTAVNVAAFRTFATDETETIPEGAFTRDVVLAVTNLLVGSVVFGIVLAIGILFLVLPGLFLLVSLYFWYLVVAVEDENFVTGFRRSWRLTRGHRLRLFGLGLVVILLVVVINAAFQVPGAIVGGIAGLVVGEVGQAFGAVFLFASSTRAYVQLIASETASDPDAPESAPGS